MTAKQGTDQGQLLRLLQAGHPLVAISTQEEKYAKELVAEAAVELSLDLQVWTVIDGIREGLLKDGPRIEGTEHPAAGMLYLSRRPGRHIALALDMAGHLSDARTLRVVRELVEHYVETGSTLVMIDSTGEIPEAIEAWARRFELELPDEEELERVVRATLRMAHKERPIEIDLKRSDFRRIIENLRGLTRRQARQVVLDAVAEDRRFDQEDIKHVLAHKRLLMKRGGALEYVEAPSSLQDIGGLDRLKRWLAQREGAMDPKGESFGLARPRGVLLLGVQGAGKSLCAKAIAAAWQRPLLRLDAGALYDKYIGESEKRLSESLRQVEMMAPIILWIDEIEKAFAGAASRSTDGGLSRRMFGKLLTWMQEHHSPVFMVATANDIEALPAELLRKGRFDEIFFVDLPKEPTRKQIFEIHLRKRGRDSREFDLDALAAASEGFSGAEIEQAVMSGLHEAFSSKGHLTTDMLLGVLRGSPPLSVTMAEKVAALRQWAKGRCVPAD